MLRSWANSGDKPTAVWKPDVPRIPDEVLHCVIYLYPSIADAENGRALGGSGFLTSVPNEQTLGLSFHYFVTNRHIIDQGSTVVRINRRGGGFECIDATERDWTISPYGDDLAVCAITFGDAISRFEIRAIPRNMFVTEDIIKQHEIGPGDDTWMAGRFVSHEGRGRNLPSVRFGNIAQMPWEPIRHHWGNKETEQESFLVEARSIPGYSGSPVFVHIPALSNRPSSPNLIAHEIGTWLLGIDWAHMNDFMAAVDDRGNQLGFKVRSNSGMMAVVPAWKLARLLDSTSVKGKRDEWYATQAKLFSRGFVSLTMNIGSAYQWDYPKGAVALGETPLDVTSKQED